MVICLLSFTLGAVIAQKFTLVPGEMQTRVGKIRSRSRDVALEVQVQSVSLVSFCWLNVHSFLSGNSSLVSSLRSNAFVSTLILFDIFLEALTWGGSLAVTLPRLEAAGRDGAAVKSRWAVFGGQACWSEQAAGQHDCFQPGKCWGVLWNWGRTGEVSFTEVYFYFSVTELPFFFRSWSVKRRMGGMLGKHLVSSSNFR